MEAKKRNKKEEKEKVTVNNKISKIRHRYSEIIIPSTSTCS